jgi:hypothetical protein
VSGWVGRVVNGREDESVGAQVFGLVRKSVLCVCACVCVRVCVCERVCVCLCVWVCG